VQASRISLNFSTQVTDVNPQQVRIQFIGGSPIGKNKLMMGQHFACKLNKNAQDIEFRRGQRGGLPIDQHIPVGQVHTQTTGPIDRFFFGMS
jgi:hypothetical protein